MMRHVEYNRGNHDSERVALAEADEIQERAPDLQRLKKRLDILDQRIDNMDSMVSAVAERVLSQLVTLSVTCPHCGREIEVAIVGNRKPKR